MSTKTSQRLSSLQLADLFWKLLEDEDLDTRHLVLRYLQIFMGSFAKELNLRWEPATAQAIQNVLKEAGLANVYQHGMKFAALSKNGSVGFWLVDASEDDYIHLYYKTKHGVLQSNLNAYKDWKRALKKEITVLSRKAKRFNEHNQPYL